MSIIKNIEKIPEEARDVVETGLGAALKRGSLGKTKIDFVQIENSLSGGKTGAVVFVARYGITDHADSDARTDNVRTLKPALKGRKKKSKDPSVPTKSNDVSTNSEDHATTFIRVLKIATKDVCESENEGFLKTREKPLDIFSQVEYYIEDEFEYERKGIGNSGDTADGDTYGILLYQDVGTVAASDLKGVARYFSHKIMNLPPDSTDGETFAREIAMLLQKEVFLGLKKGLYGTIKRRDVNLTEFYGDKLTSAKVKQGLTELRKIDKTIPDQATVLEYFNINATYHEVNYVHGDLNVENVLVWENDREYLNLSCKLIDFGEVMPKKRENFTPLFWDFSRLMGEMILNFVEERLVMDERFVSPQEKIDKILNDFWSVIEAFFRNDPSKLEKSNVKIEYISRIYLSTLFDFINEAKSGLKDLRRAEVMQDYFYCQILFFLFYTKFPNENVYKRLFSAKLAMKFYKYAISGESALQSLILSLEKYYFEFSSVQFKNKQPPQIVPVVSTNSGKIFEFSSAQVKNKQHLQLVVPAVSARSPFMGLSDFQKKDREKSMEELLRAIDEKPVVALVGASGSGKSSIVHAGVIPELRKQGYLIYEFRPGANPYTAALTCLKVGLKANKTGEGQKELIYTLREILDGNIGKRIFLLGDQFEELFTLCNDARQREELCTDIIDCAKEYKNKFRFFISIRSDFWTKLLEDAGFSSVVGDSGEHKELGERFFLTPMTVEDHRSTIEKPQIGPAVGARSPFMGLSYFQEKDRKNFFGREKFTEELLKAIDEKPVVALAGASGSGKSSVVHAGVIPELRKQGYLIYKFRPGMNPYMAAINAINDTGRDAWHTSINDASISSENEIESKKEVNGLGKDRSRTVLTLDLKEIIGNILKNNPTKRIFLLGDQFEELFTLCNDVRQREDLGSALIDCAKEYKDRFRFFITIRSDFWTKLLEDTGFSSVVGDSGEHKELGERFFLSPMTVDELRSTIEKPLAISKLFIQDGLTDLILSSIAKEPSSLPLLEFCLEELWKKQVDYTLNYNAYKKIGEVKGALATYAEQVYFGLTESEKDTLKKIMLQLVQPGKRAADTKRIALVEDVVLFNSNQPMDDSVNNIGFQTGTIVFNPNGSWNAREHHQSIQPLVRKVNTQRKDSDSQTRLDVIAFINTLTDKRLIMSSTNESGKQTIEIIHEALIQEWKQLKEWINADREFRVWQEKIRYAIDEWDSGNREDGMLLHGSSRVMAEEFYKQRKNDLTSKEIEFIEKSIKLKLIKDWKRIGEEDKKKRTQSIITIGSITAAVVAIGLSWFAFSKMQDAEDSAAIARMAKIEAEDAIALMKEAYENVTALNRWSKYEGAMNWGDANKKCKSLGKGWRLPKRGEWQANYSANKDILSTEWLINGSWYWTSDEFSEANAYGFDVYSGAVSYGTKSSDGLVRCIR